jgi:hypothetical protein|tara:strand:- start:434 stop:577 length:144 start_codon:yes stop_codon:yes gene_type:complete
MDWETILTWLIPIIYVGGAMWGMGRSRRRLYYFLGFVVLVMWLFGWW